MNFAAVRLVIPAELYSKARQIARRAKAKQAEVYRLAIRCGLAEAEQRLLSQSQPLFPNINPLPRHVLDRWYRSRKSRESDKLETAATAAQSIRLVRDDVRSL